MKNLFFILGVLLASFLLFSSFSLRENPQDPPRGEKSERHLKLIKVEDGKKTELDTIIKGDNIFVWNGDTISSGKGFNFFMSELPNLDSLHKNFSFHFNSDDDHIAPPFVMPPDAPRPPKAPHIFHFKNKSGENIIDLSDPGIISYKKSDKSGGREKIVIIREKNEENENEEVDISWTANPSGFLVKAPPKIEKRIKVIKNEDGEIEIIENEDLKLKSNGESIKVLEENGKVIVIKEKKKKGKNEVEVEVEVKENETENSQENN
jgi:hypothetical protein